MTRKDVIDVIHKTIYQFFDVCGDNEEIPMSDKDKLLLEVNKAICNNLEFCEDKIIDDHYWQGFHNGIRTEKFRAGKREPCEDCVDRQEIRQKINRLWNSDGDKDYCMETLRDFVSELPLATPTRKKGKWINILPCTTNFKDQIIYQCVCDRCGSIAYFRRMCGKLVGAKYCPNCGAEMESEDEY